MSTSYSGNDSTTSTLKRQLRFYKTVSLIYTMALLVFIGYLLAARFSKPVYEVRINGKMAATVSSDQIAQEVLSQIKDEKSDGLGDKSEFVEKVTIKRAFFSHNKPIKPESLKLLLDKKLTLKAPATIIVVNDEPVAAVTHHEDAERALDELKSRYAKDRNVATEPSFKEHVTIEQAIVDPAGICRNVDETVETLMGAGEETSHQVQEGENAWSIARKYGMNAEELNRLNPGRNMDRLGIGDEIKVAQEKPLITVVTVERQDVIDKIPYQTHTRQNSGVFEGKEFIIQYGQFGRQRIRQMVTCENGTIVKREVENRTVLSNPHDQISVIGTKPRH